MVGSDNYLDGARGLNLQQRDQWRGKHGGKAMVFARIGDRVTKAMAPSGRIARRLARKSGGK